MQNSKFGYFVLRYISNACISLNYLTFRRHKNDLVVISAVN